MYNSVAASSSSSRPEMAVDVSGRRAEVVARQVEVAASDGDWAKEVASDGDHWQELATG